MIRVFDFRCSNGHTSEHFVQNETAVQCPQCDQLALRMPAAPRSKLEPFTGAFPGAADKWVRDRESKMAQERHNMEEHGTYK
ncbi:MAG TPA: hypothetical protein VFW03_13660 [Gemmatimonadaceae bacterium]|nr:hypothetical protein [Gemmatimonadaceae bacterium]